MAFFKKLVKGIGKVAKGLGKVVGGSLGMTDAPATKVTLALPPGFTPQSVGALGTFGTGKNILGQTVPETDQLKWYEQSWFKPFMIILGIVVGVGTILYLIFKKK
jgi:hypothetical protein